MATDPFTDAAREEACRYHWELREGGDLYYPPLDFGQHMAEWARTHLAAQEPTDAEVEAAAEALVKASGHPFPLAAKSEQIQSETRALARAALTAARAARRDEESR